MKNFSNLFFQDPFDRSNQQIDADNSQLPKQIIQQLQEIPVIKNPAVHYLEQLEQEYQNQIKTSKECLRDVITNDVFHKDQYTKETVVNKFNAAKLYAEELDLFVKAGTPEQKNSIYQDLCQAEKYLVQYYECNEQNKTLHDAAKFQIHQGPIDIDTHYVYQREVGYSKKEKIGTDNIQECVAVIAHDPKTKNTTLMHVDVATDQKSINRAIDNMTNWDMNTKMQSGYKASMGKGHSS